VEARWRERRGDLLMLGENEPVRLALLDTSAAPKAVPGFVQRAFAGMSEFEQVQVRNRAGRTFWSIESPDPVGNGLGARVGAGSQGIPVHLPLTDLTNGDTIGALEASLHATALVPSAARLAPSAGPLTAVFVGPRAVVVPSGADERLFGDERVEWGGHRWLTVRRTLSDPPIELAMAGSLEPYVGPFERAAGRAALAWLMAAGVAVLLVALLTRRLAREVERELAERRALATVGEFASELAHEVRNPLTAMRLDLQRIEEEASDPSSVRAIAPRVLRQIERLDRAVTGALRVARSGSFEPLKVDLAEVLEAARRAAEAEFGRRGARLVVETPPREPITLAGDADALEQLFLNLLINAAHALPQGGEARVTARRSDGAVEVRIEDDGAGMTPERLAEVQRPVPLLAPGRHGSGPQDRAPDRGDARRSDGARQPVRQGDGGDGATAPRVGVRLPRRRLLVRACHPA